MEKPHNKWEGRVGDRRTFVAATGAALAALNHASAEEAAGLSRQSPKGTLVVMGGKVGSMEADLLRQCCFLQGDSLKGETVVCVSGANGDPEDCARHGNHLFKDQLGAKNVVMIHMREDANDPNKLQAIRNARMVKFLGGDQKNLVEAFGGTEAHRALLGRYAHDPNLILIGNSAGTAAMSKHMVYKGLVLEGLGFHDRIIFDMHLHHTREGSRLPRLQKAVAEKNAAGASCIGLGIDEGTALVIKNGHAGVIGNGKIYVVGPGDCAAPESDFHLVGYPVSGLPSPCVYPHGGKFELGEYAAVPAVREKPTIQASVGGGR